MKVFGYSEHEGETEEDIPVELYIPKFPCAGSHAAHSWLWCDEEDHPSLLSAKMVEGGVIVMECGYDEWNEDENIVYCYGPDEKLAKATLKAIVNERWIDAIA